MFDSAGGRFTETGGAAKLTGATVALEFTCIAALFHTGALYVAPSRGAGVVVGSWPCFAFGANPVGKWCHDIFFAAADTASNEHQKAQK